MALDDIIKFQLKRVNPFQGLVIDTDIWRDAHEYHRDQQRLHLLAFHGTGIVEGLEVTAASPANLTVNIGPGMAVDPEGNIIILSKSQRYSIQSHEKTTIHIIIQFREVPGEPYQPPDGGNPTRILEAYRIQEREKLPNESYLELARIDFDPAGETIKNAKNPSQAGKNEINLGFRQMVSMSPVIKDETPVPPVPKGKPEAPVTKSVPTTTETISIGHVVLGEADPGLHLSGIQNLVREINRFNGVQIKLEERIALDKKLGECAMIYVTGKGNFDLPDEQKGAIGDYLKSGGVVFGEGCADGDQETASKGAKEFGLSFNQLAGQLDCKLEVVQQGHPLLASFHVFSESPQGTEPAMLLEGGHMIYSAADYGCAWQGGHKAQPLSRQTIRDAFEMGTNIVDYARMLFQSTR